MSITRGFTVLAHIRFAVPCVLAITFPWVVVMGSEILRGGCRGAGTERTTRFVPPTSVVITTVLDADDATCVTVLETLVFDGDECVVVVVTAVLVTEAF